MAHSSAVLMTAAKPKCGGSFTASKIMSSERRCGDELDTANLCLGVVARRTLARFRLASLAEAEISFPSSILLTEGGRGQTR
jgi:hypothetical protein